MSAADIFARTNVVCKEIIEMYEENKVPEETLTHLLQLLEKKEQHEFLKIAYQFRHTMAFLDHDKYTEALSKGWDLLDEAVNIELKNIRKKVQAMQADTKADPDALHALLAARDVVDQKKATTKLTSLQLRAEVRVPFHMFMEDPNFDAVDFYEKNRPKETWIKKMMSGF